MPIPYRSAEVAAMCRRFAELHIAHWRTITSPAVKAESRRKALWWLARMKEYAA